MSPLLEHKLWGERNFVLFTGLLPAPRTVSGTRSGLYLNRCLRDKHKKESMNKDTNEREIHVVVEATLSTILQTQLSQLYHPSMLQQDLLKILHIILGARTEKNQPRFDRFSLSPGPSHLPGFYLKGITLDFSTDLFVLYSMSCFLPASHIWLMPAL